MAGVYHLSVEGGQKCTRGLLCPLHCVSRTKKEKVLEEEVNALLGLLDLVDLDDAGVIQLVQNIRLTLSHVKNLEA